MSPALETPDEPAHQDLAQHDAHASYRFVERARTP
jgi:hypothetical protein